MALSATTGPSPGCRVLTWVSVTLNGPLTLITGAAASVDPVTSTLPVAPDSVHSGAAASWGAAVGHVLAAGAAVSVELDVTSSATVDEPAGDVLDEAVSESEPQAARGMASDAAQAAMATEEDTR